MQDEASFIEILPCLLVVGGVVPGVGLSMGGTAPQQGEVCYFPFVAIPVVQPKGAVHPEDLGEALK